MFITIKLFTFNLFLKTIRSFNYQFMDENEYLNNHINDVLNNEVLKKLRLWDKRFNEILKEIGIFCIFLFILFIVSFSNLSNSSFNYNQSFKSTFIDQQISNEISLNDVIFTVLALKSI